MSLENITVTRTGTVLHFSVDLAAAGHPSKSGKVTLLATTHGYATVDVETQAVLTANVFVPLREPVAAPVAVAEVSVAPKKRLGKPKA